MTSSPLGSSQLGKSAFNWSAYKNRKSALQYLKRNSTLVDTIIETEDGSAREYVHSQVISAFGEKISKYISENGTFASASPPPVQAAGSGSPAPGRQMRVVRIPKLNRYTMNILVECAYTGYIRTDLPSGGIWQVLEVADHYEMAEVIRACCAFLCKNLSRWNCVHFYHIGVKHRHPLQRVAWQKIRANFKHILGQNLRAAEGSVWTEADAEPTRRRLLRLAYEELQELAEAPEGQGLPQQQVGPADLDNDLATMSYEHFEPLLQHDKLNVENEESVWLAVRHWCNHRPERQARLPNLLAAVRLARLRSGAAFCARYIWQDPLVRANEEAQRQLALMERHQRDLMSGASFTGLLDGHGLPCASNPRQVRPRVPNSLLLAIGGWQQGQPTSLIEAYDLNSNQWFESRKRIMSRLAYHGLECINGLLYICGGTDGHEIVNELFTFDPVRGTCHQRPSMREARCYVSTAVLGGHLYALGGHNGLRRMRSVERFELSAEMWQRVVDMNVARSDASACAVAERIYIAGGLNDQVIESSVEFYSAREDAWTFVASMLTPRTSFTLLLYRNSLLAIGGNNGTERLASVEQYSLSAKTWRPHSQMRHRRSTFDAALLEEDKLLVVGGYNGQTPFSQVEAFDEETRAWRLLPKIRFDRSGLKVVVVRELANAADYSFLGEAGGRGATYY